MTSTAAEPFRIDLEQPVLDDLARRLAAFRPPPSPERANWDDGMDGGVLAELVAYWRHGCDWRAQEAALNALPQFKAQVGGATMHFARVDGRGPAPFPLLLAHGWPDGFNRFTKLAPLLADPAAHGGDAADASTVVVPSLPGYGFSSRAAHGTGVAQFGSVCHRLMTQVLGLPRYGAHGGDIGSMVCEQLARDHAGAVAGVHLTDVPLTHTQAPPHDPSPAEARYLAAVERFRSEGGGYMHIQGTKPWTPAAALNDSPAGLLAWTVEKFQAWSDCGGDPRHRYTPDELITNAMLYWVTQSIGTSFLAYRDFTKPGPVQAAVDGVKDWLASARVPAGSRCSRGTSPTRHGNGPNGSSTCTVGRRCRPAATSPRWRSRSCSPKTSGPFSAHCAVRRRAIESIEDGMASRDMVHGPADSASYPPPACGRAGSKLGSVGDLGQGGWFARRRVAVALLPEPDQRVVGP